MSDQPPIVVLGLLVVSVLVLCCSVLLVTACTAFVVSAEVTVVVLVLYVTVARRGCSELKCG
jgi:hypothetical protein